MTVDQGPDRRRWLLALRAAGVLAGAITLSLISPQIGQAARGAQVITCAKAHVAHPSELVLYCGDANAYLQRLRWDGWGSRRATAKGNGVVNSCDPSCAEGSPLRYRVQVSATGLSRTSSGGSRYTSLLVTATGDRPDGVPMRQRFRLTTTGPLVAGR